MPHLKGARLKGTTAPWEFRPQQPGILIFQVRPNIWICVCVCVCEIPCIFSLDIGFWVDSSFSSELEKHWASSFWPPLFLVRSTLEFEMVFPYTQCVIFLWLLWRYFSIFLVFRSLIVYVKVHISLNLSCSIFFHFFCRFMSFVKFGSISAIISPNIFLASTSFSFPSDTSVAQMTDLWLLPHIFLRLCTF